MKKVSAVIAALLLPIYFIPVYAQVEIVPPPTSGGSQYNQSNIQRIQMQYMSRYQNNLRNTQYITSTNPGAYTGKGFVSGFFFRDSFGFNSFYSHRVRSDLYLVGELGYYYGGRDNRYASITDQYGYGSRYGSGAMLIPLYFGVRKGLSFNNLFKRFYPYIGTGGGAAAGIGYQYQPGFADYSFQVAPSVYALIGTEIYTTKRMFFDFNIRYRHIEFAREIVNWKDFSGFSFSVGFGYGMGGMQYLK